MCTLGAGTCRGVFDPAGHHPVNELDALPGAGIVTGRFVVHFPSDPTPITGDRRIGDEDHSLEAVHRRGVVGDLVGQSLLLGSDPDKRLHRRIVARTLDLPAHPWTVA